jgi:hypothetical protein
VIGDGKLSQDCRCGGTGYMFKTYDQMREGGMIHTGYLAKCEICGASTGVMRTFERARAAWLLRRCPLTHDVIEP